MARTILDIYGFIHEIAYHFRVIFGLVDTVPQAFLPLFPSSRRSFSACTAHSGVLVTFAPTRIDLRIALAVKDQITGCENRSIEYRVLY
jgi:hypothetical protein